LLGGAADPLDHPLNLTGRYRDATSLLQMPLGFEISGFVGPFQTDKFGQGRGVAHFQSQRIVGGITAPLFACMIVVVTTDLEAAKNPLCLDGFSALANLPGFGLVSLINPLGPLAGATIRPTQWPT